MRRVATGLAAKARHLGRGAVLALGLLLGAAETGAAFETAAPTAILTDFETKAVLFEVDADAKVPPASLVKLMTTAVIFNELKDGRLSLDDRFAVSEHAWRTGGASSGGSTMFLPLNSEVSVEDLIKGIVIQSGNDATIVVAEGIAGSVDAFAQMMNRQAEEIGLTGSHFTNPHGLPDPEQHVTMRDLARLAEHLIREYPDYYEWFSEDEFTFNDITQGNRNPLLAYGADGLKTGHTSEAGFGLVASAERDGRRIILAMNGMKSASERAEEARKLMEWGFRGFENLVLLAAGAPAGEAPVRGGVLASVPLVGKDDITILAPRGGGGEFQTRLAPSDPVTAPIAKGAELGKLQVVRGDTVIAEHPLFAAQAVEQASFARRMWDMTVMPLWDTTVMHVWNTKVIPTWDSMLAAVW